MENAVTQKFGLIGCKYNLIDDDVRERSFDWIIQRYDYFASIMEVLHEWGCFCSRPVNLSWQGLKLNRFR